MSRLWLLMVAILLGGGAVGISLYGMTRRVPATISPPPDADAPTPAQAEQQPSPELLFSETKYNFGRIKSIAHHVFRFTNQSGVVVRKVSARASCTCVITKPEPAILRPGETGQLSIEIDPSRLSFGTQRQTITVEYQGAESRQTQLTVIVENRPDVVVPDRVELTASLGKSASSTFVLVDYRDKPLVIRKVRASSPDIQVAVVERPTSYLPGWQYRLEAKYSGKRALGKSSETIWLETDDPDRSVIPLAVSVQQLQRIRVAPTTLHLRGEPGAEERVGKFFATDTEGEEMVVKTITPSRVGLRCKLLSEKEGRCEFEVRYRPDGGRDDKPLSVTLEFSHPLKEVVCISVTP